MSHENILLAGAHIPIETMNRQTMRARYRRPPGANSPDTTPYRSLINSMPVFYHELLEQTGLELVGIKNDLPWCNKDVTLFAFGHSDPHMLYDLQPLERDWFLGATRRVIDRALALPDCMEAYVGIGFNPEDDAYGCHTIKRLHAHICSLDKEYLESRQPSTLADRKDPYYRMVYYEPFTPVFGDLLKQFSGNTLPFIRSKLRSFETNTAGSYISMRYPRELYATPYMNSYLSDMLSYLSSQYGMLESIYTDRVVDPRTNRFLPANKEERLDRLAQYLEESPFLSQQSKGLLEYFAQHITTAEPRKTPTSIEKASQLWMSKGFSGAFIFRFWPNDSNFGVEYYPKILATQAMTRGNGVNSGACTYKDNEHLETDPELNAEMEQYIQMAKDAFSRN